MLLYLSVYTINVIVLYMHFTSGGTEPVVHICCIRCVEPLFLLGTPAGYWLGGPQIWSGHFGEGKISPHCGESNDDCPVIQRSHYAY